MKMHRGRWIAIAAVLAALGTMGLVSDATEVRAAVSVESPDYLTFEYQQVGSSEEEAVRLACLRAVYATVGYALFSDYALQGRDLLEPYLQKNWPKFVASSYVLERRAARDGFGVRIRVQTLPEVLTRDLREKRFLYLPDPNPSYVVFSAEYVDGQQSGEGLARQLVTEKLAARGAKVLDDGSLAAAAQSDVLSSPQAFDAARITALRAGAHVMVAARAVSSKISESPVLYDTMITYETRLSLQIIRSDDGSVLARQDSTARAADKETSAALRDSIQHAVDAAMESFGSQIQTFWASAVRQQTSFQILFTDVTLDELAHITSYLEDSLGYGTRSFVRSYFGNTAVVALATPRDFSALERALHDFRSFQLRPVDRIGSRLTVQVIH